MEENSKTKVIPEDELGLLSMPSPVAAMDFQDHFENCQFCCKDGKYKCPQCNASYCSLACYKSASHLNCSEKFYKNQVEDELKNTYQDCTSKKEMVKILQRINQNFDENYEELGNEYKESDDAEDIAKRMKGVDLDDSDAVWENLSQKEQKEFLHLIKTGDTSNFIPPWKPWWEARPVEEVTNSCDRNTPTFMDNCPSVVSCPLLSSIMKSSPSPCIPFNILNVLAAYVWVVRIFNGDHQDNCIDACEALLTLSPVLSKSSNYESAQIAVTTPMVESQNYQWLRESEEFNTTVQKDVRKIVEGPSPSFRTFYIVAALSDMHALFNSCKLTKTAKPRKQGAFSASFGNSTGEIDKKLISRELVKKCLKKIEFFISYIKEYPKILCET